MRACGILLPIFSLPGSYGIGTFGKEAYQFIDFLEKANQKYWQILPLGPTSFGNSPYQTYSTFAGSENYLDLESLYKEALITKEELIAQKIANNIVDYDTLKLKRIPLYKVASQRFFKDLPDDFNDFVTKQAFWLDAYAKFRALKTYYNDVSFNLWPSEVKKGQINQPLYEAIKQDYQMHLFIQYTFFKQWFELKAYANLHHVKIIGDLPIYVSYDSSDVWQNPTNFLLNDDYQPIKVAGCPPDAFSEDGQLWGNPIYNYSIMKQNNYDWWVKRLKASLELYDLLRIDHFRGFEAYFTIDAQEKTAKNGVWVKGPGFEIFEALYKQVKNPKMIMEDLGFLTKQVYELLIQTGYPGMRILEFAFDGRKDNPYLPHNYIENTVVYTGTHDNLPLVGWIKTLSQTQINQIITYFSLERVSQIPDALINTAIASLANLAIIPLQDYLLLDEKSRINTPSTIKANWQWRLKDFKLLDDELIVKLYQLSKKYYR